MQLTTVDIQKGAGRRVVTLISQRGNGLIQATGPGNARDDGGKES
jgi:hypothetical protein